ncbi:MAG: hypothetical protein V9E92_01040 [Methylotenera sp.]
MKELLDKISTYNIFNFLLPGVIFSVFATKLTTYDFIQEDLLSGAFVYYFIGLVISRIGSLIIEPSLKKARIISFSSYENFLRASMNDPKLAVLSETNNMYRTICALLLCIAVLFFYDKVAQSIEILKTATPVVCVVGLLALFLFSYRKQTFYIQKRVSANKDEI